MSKMMRLRDKKKRSFQPDNPKHYSKSRKWKFPALYPESWLVICSVGFVTLFFILLEIFQPK